MKTLFTLTCTFYLLVTSSCSEKPKSVENKKISEEKKNEQPVLQWNNPNVFAGSNFGEFYQVLYKQNLTDELIKYTFFENSTESSKNAILEQIKKNMIATKLKLIKTDKLDSNHYLMHYQTNIMATSKMKRMKVVVINDTVRLDPFWDEGIFAFHD